MVYDELLGEEGEVLDSHRFDMVEKLGGDDAGRALCVLAGRAFAAASAATPAATSARPAPAKSACSTTTHSGIAQKAAADSFEENMFHIIRAFHVAGRCTDCGECSRVCPQNIPLHLLNRKFIKDINTFYGAYQAGEDTDSRAPLTNYTKGDVEPSIVYRQGRGKSNAQASH